MSFVINVFVVSVFAAGLNNKTNEQVVRNKLLFCYYNNFNLYTGKKKQIELLQVTWSVHIINYNYALSLFQRNVCLASGNEYANIFPVSTYCFKFADKSEGIPICTVNSRNE